jgi:hypothetical protein
MVSRREIIGYYHSIQMIFYIVYFYSSSPAIVVVVAPWALIHTAELPIINEYNTNIDDDKNASRSRFINMNEKNNDFEKNFSAGCC